MTPTVDTRACKCADTPNLISKINRQIIASSVRWRDLHYNKLFHFIFVTIIIMANGNGNGLCAKLFVRFVSNRFRLNLRLSFGERSQWSLALNVFIFFFLSVFALLLLLLLLLLLFGVAAAAAAAVVVVVVDSRVFYKPRQHWAGL